MQYRLIGRSGLHASRVILGTWATGGFQWGGTEEQESIRAIHAALDEGINAIDTAPIYGFGESEIRVGKAVSDRRDKVLLATKCGLVWHTDQGKFLYTADDQGITQDGSGRKVFCYLHPLSVRYEIERSLKRLNTEYIDLYQIHAMDETTPIPDILELMQALKQEGKIRAFGVCNASVEHLEQYHVTGYLDSDQERYSLFDREVEKKNVRYCEDHGVAFIAYSALFHGLLTGKTTPDEHYQPGDFRRTRQRFTPAYIVKVNQMLSMVNPIAGDRQASISQIVLAYMLRQPGCTHVLAGARKVAHASENARAGGLELSDKELQFLHEIFRNHLPGLPAQNPSAEMRE